MKRAFRFYYLFILCTNMVNQSAALNRIELNAYFKQLNRGVHCLIKRKPCLEEDKKAVYQAGGALLVLLGVIATSKWLSTQKNLYNPFLTVEEREILTLSPEQQKEVKMKKLADAIEDADLSAVERWLAWGADANSYDAKSGSHMLRLALLQYSIARETRGGKLDPIAQKNTKRIVLTLIQHGADINSRANLYSKKGHAIKDIIIQNSTPGFLKKIGHSDNVLNDD